MTVKALSIPKRTVAAMANKVNDPRNVPRTNVEIVSGLFNTTPIDFILAEPIYTRNKGNRLMEKTKTLIQPNPLGDQKKVPPSMSNKESPRNRNAVMIKDNKAVTNPYQTGG